jgi:hypothetical protein
MLEASHKMYERDMCEQFEYIFQVLYNVNVNDYARILFQTKLYGVHEDYGEIDLEKMKEHAISLGIVHKVPTIMLENVYSFMINKDLEIFGKVKEFANIVKYFFDTKPTSEINQEMRESLIQKLQDMVIADLTIAPRDIPDIFIAFAHFGLMEYDQFHRSIGIVLCTKMTNFGFPFTEFIMNNWPKWKPDFGNEERDYIYNEYPDVTLSRLLLNMV